MRGLFFARSKYWRLFCISVRISEGSYKKDDSTQPAATSRRALHRQRLIVLLLTDKEVAKASKRAANEEEGGTAKSMIRLERSGTLADGSFLFLINEQCHKNVPDGLACVFADD